MKLSRIKKEFCENIFTPGFDFSLFFLSGLWSKCKIGLNILHDGGLGYHGQNDPGSDER